MENKEKRYGLLIPKKAQNVVAPISRKPAIFNSDSEEESNSLDWVSETMKKETYGSGKSRQTKADIEKVLKDDPTAYQYDEVYDEMKKEKDEAIAIKKNDKKPKYMALLMRQAERRKREDERRKERQIQKEREAEGDEFADKEVFVTSAYKKKLEELRKLDEEDRRMERLEAIGDVTKQHDLGGFYRHLYESVISKPDSSVESACVASSAVGADSTSKFREFDQKRTRNIRKRAASSDDENNSGAENEKRVKSPIEEKYSETSKEDISKTECVESKTVTDESKSEAESIKLKTEPRSSDEDEVSDSKEKDEAEEKKPEIIPENKINIWVKRTIGEVFDAALARYYERKANRITGS